jgi:nicotinamide-nucleotide amidase
MDQNERKTETEDNSLENLLVSALAKKKFTITTAESCTGGLIAGTLINVSGASDVLSEGYITYSNEAKERLVNVKRETLKTYGAVSEQTAREMAEGAALAAGADVALSATGIAGPGGGTKDKPVGLVYIGCCVKGKTNVLKCQFTGSRRENRMATVECALELALEEIKRE